MPAATANDTPLTAGLLPGLSNSENIPFAVLEPCSLERAGGGNAVHGFQLGIVVLLELHTTGFELRYFFFKISSLPGRKCIFRGPCELRGIQEEPGIPALEDNTTGKF